MAGTESLCGRFEVGSGVKGLWRYWTSTFLKGCMAARGCGFPSRLWKVLEVFVALSYIVYESALQRFG